MNTKTRDPLTVLRAAAMRDDGLNRQEQREAIAQVETLVAALQTIAKLNSNDYMDGGIRSMKRTASDALVPFTTGQDSENNS